MQIKRIGVFSLGKVMGALYGLMGLLFGGLFSLFALLGAAVGSAAGESEAAIGLLFGLGAVVLMPIIYGGMGFFMGLLSAVFYNLVASTVGGLEIEFDQPAVPAVRPVQGDPAMSVGGSPVL